MWALLSMDLCFILPTTIKLFILVNLMAKLKVNIQGFLRELVIQGVLLYTVANPQC